MALTSKVKKLLNACIKLCRFPSECINTLVNLSEVHRGKNVAREWKPNKQNSETASKSKGKGEEINALREYFDNISDGPGVWKWLHYFEIYQAHLKKFIGQQVTLVEIGVYSGGSMPMWRQYFGNNCQVHGVDIQKECKIYENAHTKIHIGDQADRSFWKKFKESVQSVDIIIDDGGHQPEQQMVTLEEMLLHLNPGGVYICEDIHGIGNVFTKFVTAIVDEINSASLTTYQEGLTSQTTPFQKSIKSVHFYPFMVVIEKGDLPLESLLAPKHGTQWQPFL